MQHEDVPTEAVFFTNHAGSLIPRVNLTAEDAETDAERKHKNGFCYFFSAISACSAVK